MTNGAYGSRSRSGYSLDKDDTFIGGKRLDTPNRRGSVHGFYYRFSYETNHHHYHQHIYRRSEKKYLPRDFKKAKPSTFDGDVKKSKDVEA